MVILIMRIFKSKYLKYFIILGIFVIGYALTYKSWYFSFKPITFGDGGFLYKEFFIDLFNTLSPAWNGGINFGVNSASTLNYFGYNFWGGVLAKFGFDWNFILRGIMFYPLLVGFTISTLLVSRIFKNNVIVALIFGFVFSINTFIFAWLNMMVAYAILPIVVLALYEYLSRKKIVWLLIFSLTFAFTLFYEIRVGFAALLLSIILVIFYWVYNPMPRKIFLRQLIQLTFSLGIVFSLSAFFVLPLLQAENYSSISGITSQSLFGTQFYKLQYSVSLMQPYWNGEALKVFFLQPLKFYFWIYPIFAFSALFFAKKDKRIIYFSLIAIFGIFMGKGANIPFGGIYAWLYYNLPFFNFFREPIQWWVIIGFSYAVLIAYFFYYFYQAIEKLIKTKFPKVSIASIFAKILVTLPVIFLVLSIAIPAFDGRLGHGLNPVRFAQEYDLFRQFLLKEKDFYRTLSIPSNQRFTYFSSNHPYVAFNYLPENLKSLNTKLLSLESIRYIVLPDDVLGDVFVNSYNNKHYENFIESARSNQEYKPLKRVAGFGNIKMWENPNDIPHLMAVKDLVYISGPPKIAELAGIPTSKQVAYYLEEEIPLATIKEIRDVIANKNETMYKNATKIYSVADCIRCDLSKNYLNYVQFPFARLLPGNILYPLIEIKENRTLSSLASPEDKFKWEAFFGEKRAIEIQQMKEKPFEDKKYVINTLAKTNKLIDDMEIEFKKMSNKAIDNGFLATWDYLYTQKKTYDDLYQAESDEQLADLLSKITYRLNGLISKISQKLWITEGNKKKLTVNIPEKGNYRVYINNDDEANIKDAELIINNNTFGKASVADNGFLIYGDHQLSEGTHYLELDILSLNLLELSLLPNEITETNNIGIVSLKDSMSQYQLSFDYKITSGRSGRVFISDDAYPLNSNALNGNLILNSVLQNHNDEEWHHLNIFFNPYPGIKNPVLHLKGESEGSGAVFKNLSLTKVVTPTIVFVKDTGRVLDTPKITYQEITSTDYTIKIENAKKPFLLSFSEQFDGNWNILSTDRQGFYGKNPTISKYFDGNVREVAYANRIQPEASVNSLINNSKIDSLHMKLNGFSNGWLISKNGTYQIQLTFSPQKYFIIGLMVSVLTFIAVLLSIGYLLFKNKKHSL